MGVNEHERHPTLQLDSKSKQRNNDFIAVLHFTVTVVLSTMSIYKSHSEMIVNRHHLYLVSMYMKPVYWMYIQNEIISALHIENERFSVISKLHLPCCVI
jgi:hypothetical protein